MAPWGTFVLLLVAGDLVSLVLLHRLAQDAGNGPLVSAALVVLYCVLMAFVGLWSLRIGVASALADAARAAAFRHARVADRLRPRLGWFARFVPDDAPEDGALNALLAMAGGLLIAFPGVASDLVGLALLLPPTRTAARAALRRGMAKGPADEGPLDVRDYRVE